MKRRIYKLFTFVALGLLLPGTCVATPLEEAEAALARADYSDAVTRLTTLANGGDMRARTRLARLYQKGEGVPRDLLRAISLYTEAAAQGDAEAQFNLGNLYLLGEGVPQDDDWAFTYYRQAAAQGHALARKNVLEFYRAAGIAPPADLERPSSSAAATTAPPTTVPPATVATDTDEDTSHADPVVGSVPAAMTADELQALELARASGIIVDNVPAGGTTVAPPAPALSALTPPAPQVAATQPAPPELAAIKRRLAAGETDAARRDLELLADGGVVEAQFLLARVLAALKATPEAAGEASLWLKRAAEGGHAEAQFMLAEAYRRGDTLPADESEAVSWYRAAARQGHQGARQQLEAIYRDAGIPVPPGAFGPQAGVDPR